VLAVAVPGTAGFAAAAVSRREAFRRWRRTRPFWGGFLLLAGIELLLIPLSGLLLHGAVKLVVYIGIGGVFGVLLGVPVTLTRGNVVTVILKLVNTLTPLVPVTMTNVTTNDFLVASGSLQANDLNITSG
jgi:Family of unknown function (DUF6114)